MISNIFSPTDLQDKYTYIFVAIFCDIIFRHLDTIRLLSYDVETNRISRRLLPVRLQILYYYDRNISTKIFINWYISEFIFSLSMNLSYPNEKNIIFSLSTIL